MSRGFQKKKRYVSGLLLNDVQKKLLYVTGVNPWAGCVLIFI